MLVSLLTINRNNAEGLRRTVESVRRQLIHLPPEHSLEYIIVDGESTDGSLENLPQMNASVIKAEPKGIFNAINIGLAMTTGDIVGLLHSGDVYATDSALSGIIHNFECDGSLDYVWGDITIGRRLYIGMPFTQKALMQGFAPPHLSLYINRKVLEIIGMYDEQFKVAGDYDYFVRLSKQRNLKGLYLNRILVRMEPGGISQSFRNRLWNNNKERLKSLKNNGLPAHYLRILCHYRNVIKSFICLKKN